MIIIVIKKIPHFNQNLSNKYTYKAKNLKKINEMSIFIGFYNLEW